MTNCDDCPYAGTLTCEVAMPCIDWVEVDKLIDEFEIEQKGETI